ncbi:MAG: imidazoleglycerol-phosphate dehydratase HisB [Lachnospiraceae bacterium]|jgi:imidazoleglycerol-phosphate dehydratase|nr:imidazoleglycerol-phosphate dehydratase HisB [Lachnospiraceae bacterium]MBO4787872.1 imidazoleglycerol-phosphate dehydratase HisB [Lachnospiraceae bacterium]MBQ2032377.1 imidazoleglycerol-phosphate dehydratase HisB [Lachnospiraceae bacterium]
MEAERKAKVVRDTKETSIVAELNIDGTGVFDISTGIGFFDHMLAGFAKHGFFDLSLKAKGDLNVDSHHTVEDVGIVIGQAIREALGNKAGITRYGFFLLPMDETLVECAIDLSGRPYFVYDVNTTVDRLGEMDVETAREFFYAISYSAGMNLHIREISGGNNHHILEAMFKAFAKALDMATGIDPRLASEVLSTKGCI